MKEEPREAGSAGTMAQAVTPRHFPRIGPEEQLQGFFYDQKKLIFAG
jgi:hypothetical protein